MTLLKDLSLTDRFAHFVDGLCFVVAAQLRFGRLTGPTIVLTWRRLKRAMLRFNVLVAQLRAGTLPPVRPARVRAASAVARPVAARKPGLLPRRFGWLAASSPEYWHINAWRSVLEEMLADPEMAAVIAGAPEIGRRLRPICHMLAIKPPPGLALPKRVRAPRPKAERRAAPPGFEDHPEMLRWPHASFRARFGPKWKRDREREWEKYQAELAAGKKS